jgi:uncharacterized protein YidB (DUF937 family)
MGILDEMGGLLGAGANPEGGLGGLLTTALQKAGGFQGVLTKLNDSGYGAQVNSWLGKGPNMPITAEEIKDALGSDRLKQIATTLGLPLDQVAAIVAQHLPTAVDNASPNGTLQEPQVP